MDTQPVTFTFSDPRLHMTFMGRMFVRVIGYVTEFVLIAAAADFLMTDVAWLRWLGAFLALFLLDRFAHFGEGDRPLPEIAEVSDRLPPHQTSIAGSPDDAHSGAGVNLAPYLSHAAFAALEKAHDRGAIAQDSFFLALTRELLGRNDTGECLRRLDVPPEEFKARVEEFLEGEKREEKGKTEKEAEDRHDDKKTDDALTALVARAYKIARNGGHKFIETSDLFSALPDAEDPPVTRLFNIYKLSPHDIRTAFLFTAALARAKGTARHRVSRIVRHRVMNRAWTARPTPALDRISTDLTDLARDGDIGFLVGHKEEYARLQDTLARPLNPNALLVGDPGIGKETLVARLAYDLTKDKVPPALFDKRLVELHLSNLVSGANEGEMQKRLATVVDEINTAGNIILYIPDIHDLVKTSGTAYLSAADALAPVLASNAFPVIGATYPREFKEFIEPRSDFTGLFEKIIMQEIGVDEAEIILTYEAVALEAETKVEISFGAVRTAVGLAKKYFHAKPLPGSASELLKEAVMAAGRKEEKTVGPEQVVLIAEGKVNVPIHEAGDAEAESLLHLEEVIHRGFIDQEEAVKAVANALREYRSGLARPGGPIASFLFVGPTGVGKTELSKIVAKVQFGDQKALVRFDMTEYQDAESVHRFIGSPDGKMTGTLTDAIREKPYAVVLLDEFEKAAPDILNLFLQTLDDGRLTDSFGRTVDFQNTVIIATSNAHSDIINRALEEGKSMSDIADDLKRRLTDVFRPELLNRFSRIVVFKNLGREDVLSIAELNLQELGRTLSEQGIMFSASPEAVARIAELGFDPAFGARPLRRVIEEHVRALLAEKILRKELARGSKVVLRVQGEDFQLTTNET